MFSNILSNDKAKELLQNELKQKKESGTYLFYGKRGANSLELALAFSKAQLCLNEENDFCGECSNCLRIESKNYPDLHIYGLDETIKVDLVREIIYKASSSSYEGKKRIFILSGIEKLKKEAINALLKTIEEPIKGTYFILLSESLDILPTILSRSILIEINKKSAKELGITQEEYDFFLGNTKELEEYKLKKLNISKDEACFKDIEETLKNYQETKEIKDKIKLYKSLRDFIKRKENLSKIEKINFAQSINKGITKSSKGEEARNLLHEILYILIVLSKNIFKVEELLELKSYNKSNVNMSLLLKVFIEEL